MVEVVSQIKSAEEQADEIRRTGKQRVRQLRDAAEAEGKRLVESESQKAARKAAQLVSDAQAKAQAYLEEHAAQSAGDCEQMRAQAGTRVEKAAAFIVERIVESL